jgi:hypothetical protein
MPITFQNVTITGGLQLVSEGAAPPSGDPYWANVKLLMNTTSTNNQINNTFLDGSTNNFTVTRAGTTTQGSFTPFTVAGGSSYSTATNGGSGYFNGTTDYLTVPSNAAFAYGTGDFTWELWVYMNSTSGNRYILDHGLEGGTLTYNGGLRYYNPTTGIGSALYTTAPTLTAGTWNHIAVARQSGTTRLFLNGTLVASGADSNNFASASVTIAQYGGGGLYYNGYISSTRIVKGTAVYTSAFTPPTTALTAISGTSLLLNYTNAGIFDSSTNNDLTLLVNAKVSTTQAKFGTTSSSFGGDNSLVRQVSKTTINSSEDFTLECWFYQTAKSSSYVPLICDSSAVYFFPLIIDYGNVNGTFAAGAVGLYTTTSGVITTITGGLFSTGTWNHIAVSRSGGTTRLFVNGTVRITTSTALGEFTVDQIGGASINGFTLNGFLDDVRITKGIARYTSDFSVPTAAFPTF